MGVAHVGLVHRDPCKYKVKGFCAVSSIERNISKETLARGATDFVKKKQSAMIQASNFIALSTDEINTIDNASVIVIHAYVLCDWSR